MLWESSEEAKMLLEGTQVEKIFSSLVVTLRLAPRSINIEKVMHHN
jgi:hypothetical protein